MAAVALRPRSKWSRVIWFGCLIGAICFEGVGRRLAPQISLTVFYFVKDVVLIFGWFAFGMRRNATRTALKLYGGFSLLLVAAVGWTFLQMFNPNQGSIVLGLVGLRAYWLWWLAPPVIASALAAEKDRSRCLFLLALITIGISLYAFVQAASPASDARNAYVLYGGELVENPDIHDGRVRVSSTFSYLTGFSDFLTLVPALLLSLGLGESVWLVRFSAFAAVAVAAAALPTTVSRAPILMSGGALIVVMFVSGFLATRAGRRVAVAGALALVATLATAPDAVESLRSRFEGDDTGDRLMDQMYVLPPVAIAVIDFPAFGIGTGMQQNARLALNVATPWDNELEPARVLIELGLPGYLLVWMARFGLVIALVRAARYLKTNRRYGAAGAAAAYAALTMFGSLTFDHVWQALYFTGVGLILREVVDTSELPRLPPRNRRLEQVPSFGVATTGVPRAIASMYGTP